MNVVIVVFAAAVFVFFLGALFGNALAGQAVQHRGRRQATVQRRLNEEWRLLEKARCAQRQVRDQPDCPDPDNH